MVTVVVTELVAELDTEVVAEDVAVVVGDVLVVTVDVAVVVAELDWVGVGGVPPAPLPPAPTRNMGAPTSPDTLGVPWAQCSGSGACWQPPGHGPKVPVLN